MGCLLCKTTAAIQIITAGNIRQDSIQNNKNLGSWEMWCEKAQPKFIGNETNQTFLNEKLLKSFKTSDPSSNDTRQIDEIGKSQIKALSNGDLRSKQCTGEMKANDNADADVTWCKVQDTVIIRKIVKEIVVESITSDILENSDDDDDDDDDVSVCGSDSACSYVENPVSCSQLTVAHQNETVTKTYTKDALTKMASMRKQTSPFKCTPLTEDIFNASEESYPIYGSICSSTTCDFSCSSIKSEDIDQNASNKSDLSLNEHDIL